MSSARTVLALLVAWSAMSAATQAQVQVASEQMLAQPIRSTIETAPVLQPAERQSAHPFG